MTARCLHCGYIKGAGFSINCNPPFEDRPHEFREDDGDKRLHESSKPKLESQRWPEFSAPAPLLQNIPRDLPPGTYSVGKDGVRRIDTGELGPVHIPTPSYRQTQARIVREAFEAAAVAEPDRNAAQHLIEAARRCDTETLAYIARMLKG